MSEWNKFVGELFISLGDNLYKIKVTDDEKVKKLVKEKCILEKLKRVSENYVITENDMALVRISKTKDFPKQMKYFPVNENNSVATMDNPFKIVLSYTKSKVDEVFINVNLGCSLDDINPLDVQILFSPIRNSKHFSINGLATNISGLFKSRFVYDDGEVIFIEPLIEKIDNPSLININPVDTFFDVSEEPLTVSDNAIILISEPEYNKLIKNDEMSKILKTKKVVLFDCNQHLATDIVLCSLGYLPQHSKEQSKLISENIFIDGKWIDDKLYLKKFQNKIEEMCYKYLGQSYYKIPEWAWNRRKEYNDTLIVPGVLHAETDIGISDDNKTLQNLLSSYDHYIDFLFEQNTFPIEFHNEKEEFKLSIKKDVVEYYHSPFENRFFNTMEKYEKMMITILEIYGYQEFKNMTQRYNEQLSSKMIQNSMVDGVENENVKGKMSK